MIKRIFTESLLRKLNNFPILSILGPRQCGKTTLIKDCLPEWKYIDLEKPSDYIPLAEDPEYRLNQLKTKVIFDEAQQLPPLFSILRSVVDNERKQNGQFVLLGSASPDLIKQISESLAGRTSFLELTPFLFIEVFNHNPEYTPETLWLKGGYPDVFLMNNEIGRIDWFDSYCRTFIERDLSSIGIDISGGLMRKLWTMLAHINANIWNASQLASSLGINYQTVNRYADILEKTYMIRRLQPYYRNIGKRLVKSPKVMFRDTGLLHYFLGIQTSEHLSTHPARGASWEAFITEQLIGLFNLYKPGSHFYFWRTSGGAEVDLLIETAGKLIPFEIKLHSSPSKNMTKGILTCMKDLNIDKGFILYPGKETYSLGNSIIAFPVNQLLLEFDSIFS